MPEGPSMVILKEEVRSFKGKKVIEVGGNTKVEVKELAGETVKDFKAWGKHFLICFPQKTIRIHFLLFGSYRINEKKRKHRQDLALSFLTGNLTCMPVQ